MPPHIWLVAEQGFENRPKISMGYGIINHVTEFHGCSYTRLIRILLHRNFVGANFYKK